MAQQTLESQIILAINAARSNPRISIRRAAIGGSNFSIQE
jgi:hypothetical protein